jgi:hypothetical protein
MSFGVKDFPAVNPMYTLPGLLSYLGQIIIEKILTPLSYRSHPPRYTIPDGDKLISNFNIQMIG